MDGYEVYKIYLALKLHFTNYKFNYFTFNGKSRVSLESFEKRKDKFFFKKLGLKFDKSELINYFVSNFVRDEYSWIGSISKINNNTYSEWKDIQDNLEVEFISDIQKLLSDNSFDSIFVVKSTHPIIIKMFLSKTIKLETLVILNKLVNFIPDFDKTITDPVIWPDIRKKILKYDPFICVDLSAYKQKLLRGLDKKL
jgi:hypothetical protein